MLQVDNLLFNKSRTFQVNHYINLQNMLFIFIVLLCIFFIFFSDIQKTFFWDNSIIIFLIMSLLFIFILFFKYENLNTLTSEISSQVLIDYTVFLNDFYIKITEKLENFKNIKILQDSINENSQLKENFIVNNNQVTFELQAIDNMQKDKLQELINLMDENNKNINYILEQKKKNQIIQKQTLIIEENLHILENINKETNNFREKIAYNNPVMDFKRENGIWFLRGLKGPKDDFNFIYEKLVDSSLYFKGESIKNLTNKKLFNLNYAIEGNNLFLKINKSPLELMFLNGQLFLNYNQITYCFQDTKIIKLGEKLEEINLLEENISPINRHYIIKNYDYDISYIDFYQQEFLKNSFSYKNFFLEDDGNKFLIIHHKDFLLFLNLEKLIISIVQKGNMQKFNIKN